VPVYWKDGTLQHLPLNSGFQYGWATHITEDSKGNYYIVGGQWSTGTNGTTIYGYWTNFSTFTAVPIGTSNLPAGTSNSYIADYLIAVNTSGIVYLSGGVGSSSSNMIGVYWANGGNPAALVNASPWPGGGIGFAGADASGNVYFTGAEGATTTAYVPCYWENGGTNSTLLPLPSGDANGYAQHVVADTSGNLYITGNVGNYTVSPDTPVYWEKAAGGTWGAPIPLPEGTFSSNGWFEVRGIAIQGSTLYFYGWTGSSGFTTLVWWKGLSSAPSALTLNGSSFDNGNDGLCAVDPGGNFYVVNSVGATSSTTTPVYWENGGSPVSLPVGTGNSYGWAYGIVIGP